MALGMLARKLGMTQFIREDGSMVATTVLTAGPCVVVSRRTKESHGYEAIQVAYESSPHERKLTKAQLGHLVKAGLSPHRVLREFRCDSSEGFTVGQVLTVEAFKPGDIVNIRGWTKGRGFQGVIKRHGKHGGPAAHGSHFHRSTGSIGQRAWPGRVFKNMKLPGHMGAVQRTITHLEVLQVDVDKNILLIRGAVPGANNGLLEIFNQADEFGDRLLKLTSVMSSGTGDGVNASKDTSAAGEQV